MSAPWAKMRKLEEMRDAGCEIVNTAKRAILRTKVECLEGIFQEIVRGTLRGMRWVPILFNVFCYGIETETVIDYDKDWFGATEMEYIDNKLYDRVRGMCCTEWTPNCRCSIPKVFLNFRVLENCFLVNEESVIDHFGIFDMCSSRRIGLKDKADMIKRLEHTGVACWDTTHVYSPEMLNDFADQHLWNTHRNFSFLAAIRDAAETMHIQAFATAAHKKFDALTGRVKSRRTYSWVNRWEKESWRAEVKHHILWAHRENSGSPFSVLPLELLENILELARIILTASDLRNIKQAIQKRLYNWFVR